MKKNLGNIKPPDINYPTHKKLLGRKMMMLRKKADLKQIDVQEVLEYESSGMMSQIENGQSGMGISQIYKAANFFGVHPFVLLSDDDLDDERLEMYLNLSMILKKKEKSKYFDAIKQILSIAVSEK